MSRSSPEPFLTSSPGHSSRQSRYTHRQLQLLRTASTSTPLRVIAHIDLDAFYAQCEMVRLGTPRETPLAVQQWDSLIAINYAARPFGINRMISAGEARKLCPDIVLQHVATFREGEGGKWAYREDAFKSISTDKVSLDPYRAESRKVLAVMKEELSRWHERLSDIGAALRTQIQPAGLEKASIDEVFMDLSPLVFGVLLQRYPELKAVPDGDGRVAPLPSPPTTALEWNAEDNLVDLDKDQTEIDDPDWDDIAMFIGSEIVRSVRKAVWDKLHYTCSGGIARNKMIAKLGSACNKPDKQTIVRNRAVQNFLGGYKFTKIRMLGGKLGDQITAHFGTEQVSELLKVSLDQFKAKLDDDTATWLYGIIRGEDSSEVNPRTQIKSMLSAKSFRPSINSADQAEKWLRIFAADIYNRLVEDGVLENRRRPRTITLHHRQGAQVRSRQIPIPAAQAIDEMQLYELAKTLLRQVMGDGCAWPCANLSLSVGSFEDGVTKNRAIDGFLIRGEQAKSVSQTGKESDAHDISGEQQHDEKRRKLDNNGIKRFLIHQPGPEVKLASDDTGNGEQQPSHYPESVIPTELLEKGSTEILAPGQTAPETDLNDILREVYTCGRCGKSIPLNEKDEHDDWHFAKDLEIQDRQAATASRPIPRPARAQGTSGGRGRGRGGGRGKSEKGQTRLFFG